ncbi:MAG: hypothetical protein LC713_01385 [Actinobacteria bacterium]|nr:hypothetical protein [Actinomycetota bacterium]
MLEAEQEQVALDAHPYDADTDLSCEAPPGPALPYDGEVPAEVLRLAALRRQSPPRTGA